MIDVDHLTLPRPESRDLPSGAGGYIEGSSGFGCTLVNGQAFIDHGSHTGTLGGRVVRAGADASGAGFTS